MLIVNFYESKQSFYLLEHLLINNLTFTEFDPKSFEPNFNQCAVNIYSKEVPEGIVMEEVEVAGALGEPVEAILKEE